MPEVTIEFLAAPGLETVTACHRVGGSCVELASSNLRRLVPVDDLWAIDVAVPLERHIHLQLCTAAGCSELSNALTFSATHPTLFSPEGASLSLVVVAAGAFVFFALWFLSRVEEWFR